MRGDALQLLARGRLDRHGDLLGVAGGSARDRSPAPRPPQGGVRSAAARGPAGPQAAPGAGVGLGGPPGPGRVGVGVGGIGSGVGLGIVMRRASSGSEAQDRRDVPVRGELGPVAEDVDAGGLA